MTKIMQLVVVLVAALAVHVHARSAHLAGGLHVTERELLREMQEILARGQDRRDAPVLEPGVTALVLEGLAKYPVRIGAFNVQVFGDRKFGKEEVVRSLLLILPRYDILLFQEIRDTDGNSFPALMQRLNSDPEKPFSYVISERLGRSSSKEQYAYIYRSDLFQVEATYQYPESEDKYERPPYGVIFTSDQTALHRFGFLGVHTKPSAAEAEIDSLVDVYAAFNASHNIRDVVMMGDFNAGCSYTTRREWPQIRLRTDERYQWLFGDDADTTVAVSECPYDRAVVAGRKMKSAIVPDSAKVYRFDEEQNLSQDETEDVSDHFPVEFLMYGKVDSEVADALEVSNTVTIEGDNAIAETLYHYGWELAEASLAGMTDTLDYEYEEIGEDTYYVVTIEDVHNPMEVLAKIHNAYPDILTNVLYYSAKTYFASLYQEVVKKSPSFPGIVSTADDTYTLTLDIDLTESEQGRTKISLAKNLNPHQI